MKPWVKSSLLLPVFILYIFLGAYVFHKIEEPNSASKREEFFEFLVPFAGKHSNCVSSDELLSFLGRFSVVKAKGVFAASELLAEGNETLDIWSWSNSIVFASTIVTTVGYGRLIPITVGGQIFCIVFAIFGIPLCYSMLSVVGDTFQSIWLHSIKLFDKLASCLKSRRSRKVLGVLVTCLVLWLFLVMIPAVIFANTEAWSLIDAQYFSLISLSTIGFGDVIYGMEDRLASVEQDWLYKVGMLVYFLIGLSVISIVVKGVRRSQVARLKLAEKTTRRFWQNRGGRHRSYSLGTPEPVDEAVPSSGLFKRKQSVAVVEISFAEDSQDEDEIERTMAMDAMDRNSRSSSVFALSYRNILLMRQLADQDSGHGSCNNSFVEDDTNINNSAL